MEKFKSWIKQPVNFNFLVVSAISTILLVIAVIFGIDCILAEIELSELKNDISNTEPDDSVGGSAILFEGILYVLGAIGSVLVWFFAIICPALIGIVSEVFALIAKTVHKKGKITAYRALMTLCYINFFIPAIIIIFFCLSKIELWTILEIEFWTVLLLIFNISELVALIITMKNTYSKRILN